MEAGEERLMFQAEEKNMSSRGDEEDTEKP